VSRKWLLSLRIATATNAQFQVHWCVVGHDTIRERRRDPLVGVTNATFVRPKRLFCLRPSCFARTWLDRGITSPCAHFQALMRFHGVEKYGVIRLLPMSPMSSVRTDGEGAAFGPNFRNARLTSAAAALVPSRRIMLSYRVLV
jgi:hypothetical protein